MYIVKKTLDDLLREVFVLLLDTNDSIISTRGEAVERTGVLLELQNPRARLSRTDSKGKSFSCLGELLWYLSGTNSLKYIEYYIPKYREESDDDATVYGGYGPRIFDNQGLNQLKNIIHLLRERPKSRRAVIQIFSAADLAKARKEIPCTCMMQFLIRDNKLQLFVNMRSNDVYLGLPHDIFAFSMLQEIVAKTLGVELGPYKHFVGSLHLYKRDSTKAQQYIDEGFQPTNIVMPPMPNADPWDSINKLIEIEALLRNKKVMVLNDFSLDAYWQDLARMLEVFAASKEKSVMEIRRISESMNNNIYSIYIEEKLLEARRSNRQQGELPLKPTVIGDGKSND